MKKTGVTYCYIQVSKSNKETEAPVSRWAETRLQMQRKTDRKWFDKGRKTGITCGLFISLKPRKKKVNNVVLQRRKEKITTSFDRGKLKTKQKTAIQEWYLAGNKVNLTNIVKYGEKKSLLH